MENENIKKTCLNAQHRSQGAKMVEFGGFDMPLEYAGIVEEHNAVRQHCGVFDVSHMGEFLVSGPEALRFVNHIFTNDISALQAGHIAYGMMLHDNGGTVDDLLVYACGGGKYLLVVNAANIDKDFAYVTGHAKGYGVEVRNLSDSCAQIAVQGPESEKIIADVLGLDGSDLSFYTFKTAGEGAGQVLLSRTGYTGEDGFEIYGSDDVIVAMWQKLMEAGVAPCGLGCRDTLRFEAGLPLYGDELGDDVTPLEAGLSIFVKLDKPEGFVGCEALRQQKADGVKRRLAGLELDSPAIARHGYVVTDKEGRVVGHVTTGYRSITLGKSIAFAMVDIDCTPLGTELNVNIRRRTAPARVVKKRFYTPQYKK